MIVEENVLGAFRNVRCFQTNINYYVNNKVF
jgi:hypothetical protein